MASPADLEWAVAVEALGRSADSRALPVLEALRAGRIRRGPSTIWIVEAKGEQPPQWFEAASGALVAAPAVEVNRPVVNNRLRRQLQQALSRQRLRAADAGVRAVAADELARSPDESMRHLIEEVLASESDAEVSSTLSFALARLDLASGSPRGQLAAVEVLAERGDVSSIADLERFLASPESGSESRDRASQVLRDLRGKVALLTGVANLFYGASLGSVLLLAALGLAVTFGLMRVINMAHGEMIMIGAYAAYVVQSLFVRYLPAAFEWYLVAALPVAFCSSAAVGVLLERLVLRHLYGRPLETLLATWGISLGLIQTVRLVFGAQNVAVRNPSWLSGGWELLPTVVLPYSRIATIAFGIVVVGSLWFLMQRTRLGMYVRAVTQNRQMAGHIGVPTRVIDVWTFALGSGVAGLGGVALSQLGNVGPELGQSYIVDSFMVVVLGGVGSVAGTVAGALGLGILNKLMEPVAGAVLGKILLLVLLVVFIQWRPQGIFAPKGRAAEL